MRPKTLGLLTVLLPAIGAASQLGACSQDKGLPPLPSQESSTTTDLADAGEPPLMYRTSWLGEWTHPDDIKARDAAMPLDYNTTDDDGFERQKRRWIQTRLDAIWVDPSSDGRIYANTASPVEAARTLGIYQYDPAPLGTDKGSIRPVKDALEAYAQGIDGRAVTGDEKYIYADAMY